MKSRDQNKRPGLYAMLAIIGVSAGALTASLLTRGGNESKGISPRQLETDLQPVRGIAGLSRLPQPRAVPDLVFEDAGGKEHRLSEWRGKAVLLNLWATWCAPCKAEMPALDRLQARLGGERFAVVAISTDRAGPEQPAAFFFKEGIEHLTLYNDKTSAATAMLKAAGLPFSVIVDGEGREVARLLGPADWDTPEATAKIEEFLTSHGPPA